MKRVPAKADDPTLEQTLAVLDFIDRCHVDDRLEVEMAKFIAGRESALAARLEKLALQARQLDHATMDDLWSRLHRARDMFSSKMRNAYGEGLTPPIEECLWDGAPEFDREKDGYMASLLRDAGDVIANLRKALMDKPKVAR